MADIPNISEAETLVMELLWKTAPLSAGEIARALAPSTNWAENTVRTLVTRLHEKGALTASKNADGVRIFQPSIERQNFVEAESDSFLKRIFQGAAKPLLVHFATHSELTPDEVEELKSLLEKSQKKSQKP